MDLFDVISNDIKEAMKAKDKVKLENFTQCEENSSSKQKTAPGANDTLTDDAALKNYAEIGKNKAKTLLLFTPDKAVPIWQKPNWPGSRYRSLSAETDGGRRIGSCFENNHCRSSATGPQDMGKVMGVASKALAGRAEGRMISETVKRLLN